jgi:hypothetical protein
MDDVVSRSTDFSSPIVMPNKDLQRNKSKVAMLDRITFLNSVSLAWLCIKFFDYVRKIGICQQLFNGEYAGTIHT